MTRSWLEIGKPFSLGFLTHACSIIAQKQACI